MARWRISAVVWTAIPLCALAQGPNPFVPRTANHERVNPVNVFVPPERDEHTAALDRALSLPPPPLPPPPPAVALSPAHFSGAEADRAAEPTKGPTGRSCLIVRLPAIPQIEAAGGEVIVQVPEGAGRCIAGVETQQEWLRIKFFNGRELRLDIEANPRAQDRSAELIFASLTDSQMLTIRQAGQRTGRASP